MSTSKHSSRHVSPARKRLRRTTRVTVRHRVTPERVHALRIALKEEWGWGVRRMAAELGCDHAHLIRIERGERGISADVRDAFHLLEQSYQEWRAMEDRTTTGVILYADFDIPIRIQLFENGRWKAK